jgi:hypothetical protein
MEEINRIFSKLRDMPSKSNTNNMVVFIRVLKDEDIIIQDFNNDDNTLTFDVCGEDDQYDGL